MNSVRKVIFFAAWFACSANATTYYVATTGNNSDSGTLQQPFLTIAMGLSKMGAGDTLLIRGGTYNEAINSNGQTIPTGTSWADAPVISGYPGETVILKPGSCEILNLPASYLQYIIFKDMILDGADLVRSDVSCICISLQPGTRFLRFQNLEVKNSPWSGILGGGSYHEFINLTVHDNGAWTRQINYGPGANGAYLTTNHSVVDGGTWYNNEKFGVRFFNSDPNQEANNNLVKNAVLYHNGWDRPSGGGIVLGDSNNAAYNNIIYDNHGRGIQVGGGKIGYNTLVYNNTIYQNAGYGVELYTSNSAGTVIKNNVLFEGTPIMYDGGDIGTVASNNLSSDPQFVNPGAYDFHLQSSSPAINAGIALVEVTDDRDGNPRPQGANYDIGAYEYMEEPGIRPTQASGFPKSGVIRVRPLSAGAFSIQWNGRPGASVFLYSIEGELVAALEGIRSGSTVWNTGKAASGIYVVRVKSDHVAQTAKIFYGK